MCSDGTIKMEDKGIEEVDHFVYWGSAVRRGEVTEADVRYRFGTLTAVRRYGAQENSKGERDEISNSNVKLEA